MSCENPHCIYGRAASILWTLLGLVIIAAVAGCSTPANAPPQAVEVLVPVVKPCEVAQVDSSELPSSARGSSGDIFEDVKTILADRAVLKADRERLQGANSNPCPQ